MISNQKAFTLNIHDILRDRCYQIRRKLNQQAIDRYSSAYSAGVNMPPVTVAKINNSYVLTDGFHRIEALLRNKQYEVNAIVIETNQSGAIWLAAEANLKHGLPLKSSEIRDVFRSYIRAKKHYDRKGELKSYRAIALDLGGLRRHTTIRNWMIKDFPKIAERYSCEEMPSGDGGLIATGSEQAFYSQADIALNTIQTAYFNVSNPQLRGELAMKAEEILGFMKADTEWEPPDFW